MKIDYIDQSISNLTLNISVDNRKNVEELTVLSTKIFDINKDYFIEMSIIGESHLIYLKKKENSEVVFSEVFACIHIEDDSFIKIPVSVVDKMVYQMTLGNFDYTFVSKIFKDQQSIEEIIGYFKKHNDLIYYFPEDKSIKTYFKPKTAIFFKYIDNVLYFHTLHTYPNEEKIVYTNSQFFINNP